MTNRGTNNCIIVLEPRIPVLYLSGNAIPWNAT